jgi:hypothetical protein
MIKKFYTASQKALDYTSNVRFSLAEITHHLIIDKSTLNKRVRRINFNNTKMRTN